MPNMIALGVGFFLLPLVVGGGMVFSGLRNDRRLAARFASLHRPTLSKIVAPPTPGESIRSVLLRAVSGLGEAVLRAGLLTGTSKTEVEAALRGAGYTGTNALRQFVGAKILLLVLMPVSMWFLADQLEVAFSTQVIATVGGAIGGMLAPDSFITKLRERHMKKIQNELPDALDMMVICAGAGLGLGITIIRVAQELQQTHPAVAVELAQTANEMQMMTDGKLPLINLGERCGVDSAKRLASTLLQSAQYGTPLTEALRGLAGELRAEMITRFEARAARMPVLLTLPMVAFILPSVFLVIGGPAVIQVIHALSN
jgi:tight adherence protein C